MKTPRFIGENKTLASMTSFGVGGPARYFSEAATLAEVDETFAFAYARGLPVMTLGGGSNLLIADAGVDAVVLRLTGDEFSRIVPNASDPQNWRIGAAASLAAVLERAAESGLSGLEFLAGIPGRIGGAAAMNAGGGGMGLGDAVLRVEGVDADGTHFQLSHEELEFRYRGSALLGMTALWLDVGFAGRDEPEAVRERMRQYREKKRATQPLGMRSAGCVFKNPPDASAGALLDASGCKGMRAGGAEVSRLHANFIVNSGGAKCDDVLALAAQMRARVAERFGITLKPEIRCWGCDSL